MSFIKKIKELTSSSKNRSLNNLREELKQCEKVTDEQMKNIKNYDVDFSLQTKDVEFYKNNQFDEAENYLLQVMNRGFYSPSDLTYLAKRYRKRKESYDIRRTTIQRETA